MHKDNLLILRGIACLTVVVSHLSPTLIVYGFEAVWLFFMLSGFLLTQGFLTGRFSAARQFYINRAKRLLPVFYVAQITFIAVTAMGFAASVFPKPQWVREALILTAAPWAPYVGMIKSVNSPIWSVVLEIHFVIILPWIVRYRMALWAAIVAWFCMLPFLGDIWPVVYESHYYNAGFFLLGILAAKTKKQKLPTWFALIAPIAFVGVDTLAHHDLQAALICGPFVLAPAYFLLLLSLDTDFQKRLPTQYRELIPRSLTGLLEIVGAMSYSLYLVHKFVGINFGVIAAFVVATIMYVEVESRFRYSRSNAPHLAST